MRIASAVMHYQREDLTVDVLNQLAGVADVFVFDDGSWPPLGMDLGPKQNLMFLECERRVELRTNRYRGVQVLRHRCNLGYVRAVNTAMSALATLGYEAVWTLNNDIHGISGEMLEELTATLAAGSKLAAVSPAVESSPHTEMAPGLAHQPWRASKLKTLKFIDWVCPLVRLSAWNQVGGFDENLRGFGCDVQFCYDARQWEWKFAVLPFQVVSHDMGATVRSLGITEHSDMGYMNEYLCRKYGVKRWEDLKI